MPRLQYRTIQEIDLGGGIDQQSAENQIPPGYCEDLTNADPKSTGQIAKRTGYQGYAGNLPVRVTRLDYVNADNQMCFTLDSSISLPNGQSSPIIVQGKTSSQISGSGGDFSTTEAIEYYANFEANNRVEMGTGSGTLTDDDTATSIYPFVALYQSTSAANNNNSQITPDSVEVETSLNAKGFYDVHLDYTNGTGSAIDTFILISDKTASSGDTYISGATSTGTGLVTHSITAATHGLTTNRILVKVYDVSGADNIELIPDAIRLNEVTGLVEIDINNGTGSAFDVVFVLSRAPTDNLATGSVAPLSSATVEIDTSVTGGTGFAFISCYMETTPGSTTLEQVIPTSITHDSTTNTISVQFTNNSATGRNFSLYWEFATATTNVLYVTPTTAITADDSDDEPQLTIWGLDHSEIYSNREAREGWTNYIDSYRAPAETRLISGLGGNLYAARLRTETGNATTYKMPQFYPNLSNELTSSDLMIGPAFWDAGDTPARTRGYVTGSNGGTNWFEITSIAYNSGSSTVEYTLTVLSGVFAVLDSSGSPTTIGSVISTTTGLEDYFTAQQCGYSVHNGTFKIKTITNPTTTTIVVGVENSEITTTDFDEADVGGDGGVFTDQLPTTAVSNFLVGDIIKASLIPDNLNLTVQSTSGSTTVIANTTELVSLAGGIRVVGERTSEIVPVRDVTRTADVTDIVRGDMLTYSDINRELRVKSINQLSSISSVSITGNGSEATATLPSGDTSSFFIGKKILLSESTNYSGVQEITDIPTSTTFKFSSSSSASETATLVGNTIEVDEQLNFEDTSESTKSFTVSSRWIPIEKPDDSFDLTPETRTTYFDSLAYSSQDIIRSTTVQNNLYLTNQADEVMKFDGSNIYRAGLFRWQPDAFLTVDEAATGKIDLANPSIPVTLAANTTAGYFFIDESDRGAFSIGDKIQDSSDGAIYTVKNIVLDTGPTHAHVYVNRQISGGTFGSGETLTQISTFGYYFRLNAVDANNNIIASAVTGSNDHFVDLGADAAVRIKLIGMPAWDIYDYDRLEVQIYRTQANAGAPYYLLNTLAMQFDSNNGYILYTDTDSDDTIRDLDIVNTALKGAELGTAFSEPIRAKYCTSADNRLILGNIKDYPELDIQLFSTQTVVEQADFTSTNVIWEFRKDNTDDESGTNVLDRIRYDYRNVSSAKIVNAVTVATDGEFTVTTSGSHGLSTSEVGQWVYLFHSTTSGTRDLEYSGWWQVKDVPSSSTFIVNYDQADASAPAPTNEPDRVLIAVHDYDVPVPIGTDGNYDQKDSNPDSGLSYTNQATIRLAKAINASMRKVDTTITGYSEFEPWLTAQAGGDFGIGQLVVRQPRVFSTTLEVVTPTLPDNHAFEYFVNGFKSPTVRHPFVDADVNTGDDTVTITNHGLVSGDIIKFADTAPGGLTAGALYFAIRMDADRIRVALNYEAAVAETPIANITGTSTGAVLTGNQSSAITRLFPSRLLISYPNFPEIFDNPTAQLDSESDSAIDINSADGQEITAVIPFFGDSAFGAAQKSGILVVFKTNSVYLVDLAQKAAGQNAVQRLETRGKGCTAPFSVAVSKDGIMFANETGIYRLNRNLKVDYIGRRYERKWLENINKNQIDLFTGHHDNVANSYKLSYSVDAETENSLVFTYNHTREYESQGDGSITTYDNHPAVGWANLVADSFFASTSGRVFQIRRLGETSDFRDDDQAISMDVLVRALDAMDSSQRKVFGRIITHYRALAQSEGTVLTAALDLKSIFQDTDTFAINVNEDDTGLSDTGTVKVQSITSVIDEKVGLYLQLRYQNSTIDEPVEITGIDLRVATKKAMGIQEAAETTGG